MRRFISTEISEQEFREILHDLIQPIITTELKKINLLALKPADSEKYYTRKDLCGLLRMSLPTIGRLTSHGILKPYKFGNSYRYKKSEIDKYLSKEN